MKSKEGWEPIPQRKPPTAMQDELRIEIPPDAPLPSGKQKSIYDKGEDITPADYNEHIDDEEE